MLKLPRRHKNLPLFCLLLLGLLTSPVSTIGYVWCVTPDGQSALEEAIAGDCGLDHPAPAADHDADRSETITTDDCGPCLDVAHADQWGASRSRLDEIPAGISTDVSPAVVATQVLLPEGILNPHHIIDLLPRTPEPILHHRTIVLLI